MNLLLSSDTAVPASCWAFAASFILSAIVFATPPIILYLLVIIVVRLVALSCWSAISFTLSGIWSITVLRSFIASLAFIPSSEKKPNIFATLFTTSQTSPKTNIICPINGIAPNKALPNTFALIAANLKPDLILIKALVNSLVLNVVVLVIPFASLKEFLYLPVAAEVIFNILAYLVFAPPKLNVCLSASCIIPSSSSETRKFA